VAVKVLLPALADQDPTYSARFEREARAAAALANSAVVTVYDTGVDAGSHYIVMEYVDGQSLDEILRDGHSLDVQEALRIGIRVADALAAAHTAGILHRDIKPANVMVADDGTVKVLDFGIARRLDATALTQAASIVGTAAYMAPERALGQPGDGRADIYSLGCLLYVMLTGRPPFTGEISAAILHQQINTEPRRPAELRPGLAPGLEALVLKMLAKSPDERPASAERVREALTALSAVSPVAAPGTAATAPMSAALTDSPATAPTAPATAPTAPATAPTRAATAPTKAAMAPTRAAVAPAGPQPRPSRPLLADHRRRAVLMAAATAALTVIAIALLSGGGSPRNSTPPTHTVSGSAPTTTARTAATTPATSQTQPPPPAPKPAKKKAKPNGPAGLGGAPPGHGGEPPGQAKKKKPKQ
jgi:serine/threonine-protein kinase